VDTAKEWLEKGQILKAEEKLQVQAHSLIALRHIPLKG